MLNAGFWMRLLAWIIDAIVVGVITAPIELLVDDLTTSFLFQVTAAAAYTIPFWLAKGATPGKMALGMRIVMADGRPITGVAAAFRYTGYLLSFLTLGFGYLMIATTSEKRGLHDYIAGTVVVRNA